MANHASALKAHRQSVRRRNRNRSNRSSLRTGVKNFSELLSDGKTEQAQASMAKLYSLVDKAVQKKVLSKNAAARRKSRLVKHLNEALAKPAAQS